VGTAHYEFLLSYLLYRHRWQSSK